MNRKDEQALAAALTMMRSGDARQIDEGERMLMRLARLGPSAGCSCPAYPRERDRHCYAHSYITISVAEAQAGDGGTTMRDIVAMIRRRTGAKA